MRGSRWAWAEAGLARSQLISHGRVVWRELSLRAQVQPDASVLPGAVLGGLHADFPPTNPANGDFFLAGLDTADPLTELATNVAGKASKVQWRIARPDGAKWRDRPTHGRQPMLPRGIV